MSALDPNRVRDIFLTAVEKSAAERLKFLASACGRDAALRAAVDRLLNAHAKPESIVVPQSTAPAIAEASSSLSVTKTFIEKADIGILLVDRYKLLEPIGEGGMGTVWSARQMEPVKRQVAVKLIKAGMDSKAVLARFEAERQALALMDHPNIARVLDAGTTADGRPFFVMELVKGEPITKFCDNRKLTPHQRLELFVQVCRAIQHAHQKGIIHRDIKPSNVLVAVYDDKAVPKVIDFGVAKATGQLLTEKTFNTGFGSVVGTPQYMSPEQATFNNLDIDTRSDVYSLGVLLYELLTGSTPFEKEENKAVGIMEMLRVVREDDPPRPSTKMSTATALPTLAAKRGTEPGKLRMMLRQELDWVVMKALEKDRGRRYETANGLASDIVRHLAGEEVLAVPPSLGYRMRKFIRKHRGPVIAGSIVLAALIIGVMGTTLGLLRAVAAREDEAIQRQRAEDLFQSSEAERWRAERSAEAEKTAVIKAQRLLAFTNAKEASRLADSGDTPLALLKIANSMTMAPESADVQMLSRAQFAFYRRNLALQQRLSILIPLKGRISSLSFSGDGQRFLAVSDDRTLQVWECQSGRALCSPLLHSAAILSAVFSADGRSVFTGCGDGTIRLWNIEKSKVSLEFLLESPVVAVAIKPNNGLRALTVSNQGNVKNWDVDKKPIGNTLTTINVKIRSAAYSSDGTRVVIGCSDTFARLFNVETGSTLGQLLSLHNESIESVAFSPDGRRILTGSKDQHARLWNAETVKPLTQEFNHPDWVASVAFADDGKNILTGCYDNVARMIGFESGKAGTLLSLPHSAPVGAVAFAPKGSRVLTGSDDGILKLWETSPKIAAATPPVSVDTKISSYAFPADGRLSLTGYSDGTTWLLDETRTPRQLLPNYKAPVTLTAFSPNGLRMVTGSEDKNAAIWDVPSRTSIKNTSLNGKAWSAAFSRDGTRVAIGSSAGSVWTSNLSTGKNLVFQAHGGSVQALAFSPKGQRILTGGADKVARIWDSETGEEILPSLRNPESVDSITCSPEGNRILTGCKNGTIRLFELGSDRVVLQVAYHSASVRSLGFSPDGRWAVSGSDDGILRVWDVETGIALSPPIKHSIPIVNAAFSTDGKQVIVGNLNRKPLMIDAVPDDRPLADIIGLAQLASSNRIDEVRGAVPLTSKELDVLWTNLRAKYPNEFSNAPLQ